MSDGPPYTRDELEARPDTFPERGPLCPRCNTRIPQFAELSHSDAFRIKQLISQTLTVVFGHGRARSSDRVLDAIREDLGPSQWPSRCGANYSSLSLLRGAVGHRIGEAVPALLYGLA